jgi:hypothetical protein
VASRRHQEGHEAEKRLPANAPMEERLHSVRGV